MIQPAGLALANALMPHGGHVILAAGSPQSQGDSVSVPVLVLVAIVGGVLGAVVTGGFGLVNGNRQRKADREAETQRFAAQMRDTRVARLRGDLQSLVRTILLFDRAADVLMNPAADDTILPALFAEAKETYEAAVAGLILDPDGEALAQMVTSINREFVQLQRALNEQLTLVQQNSGAAVDEAQNVEAIRKQLHDSVATVMAQARTVITKLTGAVPTLGEEEGKLKDGQDNHIDPSVGSDV